MICNTFVKVRKAACHNDRMIYENFLRCLALYNQDLVSKMELLELVQPFLSFVFYLYIILQLITIQE